MPILWAVDEIDMAYALIKENSPRSLTTANAKLVSEYIVDAAVVAGEIDPWMVARDGAELNFLKGAVGIASAPTADDTDDTGVTFSDFDQINEGVASVWGTLINAPAD